MGKVTRPGQFPFETGIGVLQALALAGGPNDFARRDHIFVIRKIPEAQRIRFTYEKLLRAEGPGATFVLQEGDVVVVE
jgi:polysaccharide export outer membrane protein